MQREFRFRPVIDGKPVLDVPAAFTILNPGPEWQVGGISLNGVEMPPDEPLTDAVLRYIETEIAMTIDETFAGG